MVLGDGPTLLVPSTHTLGRSLLTKRTELTKPIYTKWHGDLVVRSHPRWNDIWYKSWPQKDARSLWSVYHCAMVVHNWRKAANSNISTICSNYQTSFQETILHRFHHCNKTWHAWNFGLSVLYAAFQIPLVNRFWPSFTWQQCKLDSKLPKRLKHRASI